MKLQIIVLMMTLFLMGCSSTPRVGNNFYVPSYTAKQTQKVYSEITDERGIIIAPTTAEFLKDYQVLRDQVRVGEQYGDSKLANRKHR